MCVRFRFWGVLGFRVWALGGLGFRVITAPLAGL